MEPQSRILLILRYLYENTDPGRSVSSRDIVRMLEAHGVTTRDRRTIEADVDMLIAAGHDIHKEHRNGVPTRYHVVSRRFDTVELKILIDAVAASQFLNAERSGRIIRNLAAMAGPSDREGLVRAAESVAAIKSAAGRNIYVADDLYRAVVAGRKIRFRMVEYSLPGAEPPHRDGYRYTVSPYALVWSDDRYYLVAHEDARDIIITPRVDHIRDIEITDEPAAPPPEGFDVGSYYGVIYKMYSGPALEVTLVCENSLKGKVIDRFGKDTVFVPVSDRAFRVTVRTTVGPTFFGWLTQYAGRMTLAGPPEAAEMFHRHLRRIDMGPRE